MKLVAFAASNSRQSINKRLIESLRQELPENASLELLDLNDYSLPIFSEDLEKELGESPKAAVEFYNKLGQADALLIAFAEHNGSYTAVYKNLFDWMSRIDRAVFQNKPVVCLAASPGPGGAQNVLKTAVSAMPYFGGEVKASVSIPKFHDVFDKEAGEISDPELKSQLQQAIAALLR